MAIRGFCIVILVFFLGFIFYKFGFNFIFFLGIRDALLNFILQLVSFIICMTFGIGIIDKILAGLQKKKS